MPDLFDRLSTAARPYEIAVGKIIEEQSKYKYIQDKTSMDYDCYLINPQTNQPLTIEVKVHEGKGAWGKYDTACLEILEYQYRYNDYVSSHWLSAPFKVMAHVDKAASMVHFFNGQTIRQWALARKHTARYSKKVKTANIKMPWRCKEAGYLLSLPLQSSI
tara:strand:- start:1594 stop:2076 length:483 start_codon:yes stop_codon:yes gene_type:complete